MNAYLASLCATQGHVITGQGWGTGPGQTVWHTHCERCGADLRLDKSAPSVVTHQTASSGWTDVAPSPAQIGAT